MKQKTFLLLVSLLLSAIYAWAGSMEVTTNISTAETVCSDSWGGYLKLTKSQLSSAKTGDEIVVTVTACSANTAISPLVDFRNGSWTSITDYTYVRSLSLPAKVSLTLTDDMISAINGNTTGVGSGMIITGCGVTFNQVDLVKTVELTDGTGKGNAVTNLWMGKDIISWATGSNNSVKLAASAFADVTAGTKLRMSYSDLKMNGVGRILHNWTSFTDVANAKLTTDYGTYYEYTLTDDMVTSLKADGLRVSGIGYTLISIDLIDPDKEYNIIAQYDQSDIKAWEAGETPNVTVTLTNMQTTVVTTTVEVKLMTDMWEDYKNYSQDVTLASGETKAVDLDFELDPGFYRMTVNANNNQVCTYMIGYNPTVIVSPNDAQSDFWTFWDGWKQKLAAIDVNAELTELTDYSTANRKVYEVKMQSAPDEVGGEPVSIWGYYAEPVGEGTYPALIRYQGTDNGTGTPTPMGGDDNKGWCELIISTRGQMLSRVKAKAEGTYVDYYGTDGYYANNYGDRDKHYYRAAYLDCVRAIDFIASRDKTDANNIFAAGGSQGGCFTYVAAGLDDRLKAIAPSITGHADFPHTKNIVTWPTNIFESQKTALGWTDDQIDVFNSYFDTKNFASRITCPVITNFSLQDHTDGPHLNIAPYNLLTNVSDEDKTYSINPFKAHATADDWTATYMAFFNKYMENAVTSKQFQTSGTKLLDANGNEFVMRGVNYSYAWQYGNESTVIPAAKRQGFNCIRIQISDGGNDYWKKPTSTELESLIKLCEDNKLVAIFNTHDETGSDNVSDLERASKYWISMKDVLNAHLNTVIVNISNEWYGSWKVDTWAAGYKQVIGEMRLAGIKNTLMVDAAGYGQYPTSIFQKGAEVLNADSEGNLVFSIHMYEIAGGSASTVKSNIDNAMKVGAPVVIGEFGYQRNGKSIALQTILDYCQEKSAGWIGWSWTGNGGSDSVLDMFAGYDDSAMLTNGDKIINSTNGVKDTSKTCSVFGSDDDGGETSGINSVQENASPAIDKGKPYDVFNISGQRVNGIGQRGVYIIHQGNKVCKVM